MLHITVVADIILIRYQIVTFVVLVECVGQFQVTFRVEVVVSFQPATESAITVLGFRGGIPFTEIIASTCRQSQLLVRGEHQAFLHVPGFIAVDGRIIPLFYVIRVYVGILYVGLAVELAGIESYRPPMPLIIMYSETSIEVQIPRIVRSFGNDIDYPPDGT